MIDYEVAHDKLTQFERAWDIAQFLLHEGVKGMMGLADSCPVARWMQGQTGKPVGVSTIDMWIDDNGDELCEQAHTPAMRDFIISFDAGHYPNLINSI